MTTTYMIENGDWVIDARTGRPKIVADREKLRQDVNELLTIEVQSNGFGTSLDSLIGLAASPVSVRALIQQRVRDGVTTFQRLQTEFHLRQRPRSERVLRIRELIVSQIANSRTRYAFQLKITPTDAIPLAVGGILEI